MSATRRLNASLRGATLAIALALAWTGAAAGELWRCGPDGRSFSDLPCADGTPIALAAPPSAAARAEAQAVAAREQQALQRLAAERRAREAAPWAEGRAAPAAIRPATMREAAPVHGKRPTGKHGGHGTTRKSPRKGAAHADRSRS